MSKRKKNKKIRVKKQHKIPKKKFVKKTLPNKKWKQANNLKNK